MGKLRIRGPDLSGPAKADAAKPLVLQGFWVCAAVPTEAVFSSCVSFPICKVGVSNTTHLTGCWGGGEEPSKFVSRLMHSKLSMSIITAISHCLLSNRGHLFPFLI